jgi:hypothetical protein
MSEETVFHLPESVRKDLLRDAGFTMPENRHPDGHFKRDLPIQPHETLPNLQPPTPVDIKPAE